MVVKGLKSSSLSFFMCRFVSDKNKSTMIISIHDNIVISQKGAFTDHHKNRDHIIGQIINHIPNSHQSNHILCILSSFVFEISFIID
jgi:hypothetical protein